MHRIGIFGSHPVQYKAPLYRQLAGSGRFKISVAYGSRMGVEEQDLGFSGEHKWDIDLLTGYEYEFLKNYALDPDGEFFSRINPEMWRWVCPNWDALWIHAGMFTASSAIALTAAKCKGVPVILHNPSHLRNAPLSRQILRRSYAGPFLRSVDAILADCERNREYFHKLGANPDDVYLFPCAVDNDRFQDARKELDQPVIDELRSELGIPDEDTIVLFVGKFTKRKRPRDLIDAMNQLPVDCDVSAILVGDGPLREQLEEAARKQNTNRVVFAGFGNQSEQPAFYELGDLFVIPSAYDPSPKVMNEAMNFELPIVASDGVGTADDMIRDNGRVFSTGNVEQLSDILHTIIADDSCRERMGRRSLDIVNQWDFEADIEVLEEVVAEVSS